MRLTLRGHYFPVGDHAYIMFWSRIPNYLRLSVIYSDVIARNEFQVLGPNFLNNMVKIRPMLVDSTDRSQIEGCGENAFQLTRTTHVKICCQSTVPEQRDMIIHAER